MQQQTETIILKPEPQKKTGRFLKNVAYGRDSFILKITKKKAYDLVDMLCLCCADGANSGEFIEALELELLVLRGIERKVRQKTFTLPDKFTQRLEAYEAKALYDALNDFQFAHPLHNILAGDIVTQIDKQLF